MAEFIMGCFLIALSAPFIIPFFKWWYGLIDELKRQAREAKKND